METSRIEKLIEHITADEKAKLELLNNAVLKCLKEYETGNNAAQLRNWQAAEDALFKLVEDLEARYLAKPAAFENLIKALQFLQGEGYKVSKSKIYKDREIGKIRTQSDGSVLESDLWAYAVNAELKKTGAAVNHEKIGVIQEAKVKEELQLTKARREKLEFELERDRGLYTKTDDVLLEIAVKIAVLEAAWKNMVRTNADEWLHRARERPKLLCELIYADFDKLLDDFGNLPEINVHIKRENR